MVEHWQIPRFSDELFEQFASLIYDTCGIRLTGVKKTMLTSRLVSRLRALSVDDFATYYRYVTSDEGGDEMTRMIDAVSTNKTDFFREDSHFSFLTDSIIPTLAKKTIITDNRLHIWSAGCATGEEPYTMGMVLSEYARQNMGFDFDIFATDISTRTLALAETGVYLDTKVARIQTALVHRYMMRGRGNRQGSHRVVPELRRKVRFQRVNFTDTSFPFKTQFDVIFCRNVIIYFGQKTQQELFTKFYDHLKPGGYFILGHAEMMANVHKGFVRVEPSIYRKGEPLVHNLC